MARNYRPYLKGKIDLAFNIGTLPANDVVTLAVADAVIDPAWISSVRALYSLSEFTPGNDIGPVMVGFAHGDYTAAEIEEWIENLGSWQRGNMVQQEIAKRKIRQVGVFETPDNAADSVSLNDGKMITTKAKWLISSEQTVNFWAYNSGSAAIATTVPQININGHANLWPKA